MLREGNLRPNGDKVSPEEMAEEVLERGPNSLARVCFRVENRGKAPLASSPANRVFDVDRDRPAKKWLLALDPLTQSEIIRAHYISDEAWRALVSGDHRAFVEERTKTLMALEGKFMKEKNVRPQIGSSSTKRHRH